MLGILHIKELIKNEAQSEYIHFDARFAVKNKFGSNISRCILNSCSRKFITDKNYHVIPLDIERICIGFLCSGNLTSD